jgi:hypothetical protein
MEGMKGELFCFESRSRRARGRTKAIHRSSRARKKALRMTAKTKKPKGLRLVAGKGSFDYAALRSG